MKNRVFLSAVAAVAALVSPCAAEDAERPSRIATDGSQVVDYIAELEASVDSLKRQVTALENELQHKNEILNRSEPSGHAPVALQGAIAGKNPEAIPAVEIPSHEQVASTELRKRMDGQSERIKTQEMRLEEQKRKIADLTAVVESQKNVLARQESYAKNLEDQLDQRVKAAESRLVELKKVETAKQALESQLASSSVRAKELENSVVGLRTAVELEKKRHDQLLVTQETERRHLEAQLKASSARQKEIEAATRAPAQVASIAPMGSSEPRLRASIPAVESPQSALRSIVSGIRGDLSSVQGAYERREKLFADYAKSKPSVLVSPSKALSRKGESISDLETALARVKDSREAARIQRAVDEIKRIIDEDTKLIQRLTRK